VVADNITHTSILITRARHVTNEGLPVISRSRIAIVVVLVIIMAGISGAIIVGQTPPEQVDPAASLDAFDNASDSPVAASAAESAVQVTNGSFGGSSVRQTAVTFEDQASNGSGVVVRSVRLLDGGVLVVQSSENGTPSGFLGRSAFLPPGRHENVTVTLSQSVATEQTLWVIADPDDEEAVLDSALVSVRTGPSAPVGGGQNLPLDPDEDGLFEDVDGNGDVNVIDVAIFLSNFDDIPANDVQFFDFDGNGRMNIIDVAVLLDEV